MENKQFLICALLMIGCVYACRGITDVEGFNRDQAERILEAIYEYESLKGDFPRKLDDLVPEILLAIPETADNNELFYSVNSVDGFILSYEVRPGYGCGYTDKLQCWECSFGD